MDRSSLQENWTPTGGGRVCGRREFVTGELDTHGQVCRRRGFVTGELDTHGRMFGKTGVRLKGGAALRRGEYAEKKGRGIR